MIGHVEILFPDSSQKFIVPPEFSFLVKDDLFVINYKTKLFVHLNPLFIAQLFGRDIVLLEPSIIKASFTLIFRTG